MSDEGDMKDVFISYAHADSREVVKQLVGELKTMGLDVWQDDIEMSLGDSIRKSIDDGFSNSRYGIVVCSESYFEGTSEWEFNGLVKKHIKEGDVILPLLHGVNHEYVFDQSPSLADLVSETITEDNVESIATSIYRVVTEEEGEKEIWGEGEDGSLFESIDIRFQGGFQPSVGDKLTVESWRNHNAPNFSQLEATEIRDESGVKYPSSSKGTVMTKKRIDDEPLECVVSDIQTLQSNRAVFTVRVRKSRIEELSDDPSDYRML